MEKSILLMLERLLAKTKAGQIRWFADKVVFVDQLLVSKYTAIVDKKPTYTLIVEPNSVVIRHTSPPHPMSGNVTIRVLLDLKGEEWGDLYRAADEWYCNQPFIFDTICAEEE